MLLDKETGPIQSCLSIVNHLINFVHQGNLGH